MPIAFNDKICGRFDQAQSALSELGFDIRLSYNLNSQAGKFATKTVQATGAYHKGDFIAADNVHRPTYRIGKEMFHICDLRRFHMRHFIRLSSRVAS